MDRKSYAVLGIPVVHDPDDGFAHTLKQGHKCCGGCCDMRRAVIIVNIVSICFGLLALPFLVLGYEVVNSPDVASAMDDDQAEQAFSDARGIMNASLGVIICVGVAKLVCFCAGIYGALKYNCWCIGASLAAYCVGFVLALLSGNILLMLMPVLFAYPHVFFIKEVRQGIMSEDNYELEKHSCCCV